MGVSSHMKRTGFKRKSTELAKTLIKRKSVTPEAKLKKILWELCRAIIGSRYPDYCFTCDKPIAGSNRQLGHFIPSSVGGAALRYHLDNLRLQCYYCNINLGGNGSEFYPRLVAEIGQERVNALFRLKHLITKANRAFYEALIAEYESL